MAIGVVRVIDRMEQDDKVLAVMEGPTLKGVNDLDSLDKRYPGIRDIVTTWFANAHGKRSKVSLTGAGSRGQALSVIDFAIQNYKQSKAPAPQ